MLNAVSPCKALGPNFGGVPNVLKKNKEAFKSAMEPFGLIEEVDETSMSRL